MEHTFVITGTALTVHLPAEIDHHSSEQIRKETDCLIQNRNIRHILFDFGKTEFMDSSGIGVVIGRSKTMQFRDGKISASHLSKRVAMIFQSVGLQKIVEVKED